MRLKQLIPFLLLAAGLFAPNPGQCATAPNGKPWNVLFIAIDDLNDWIGPLGGHPQATTPNLDRFAKRSVNFRNAHCQAPICNPSRASLLTGMLPSSSGIYFLSPQFRKTEATKNAITLPQHFQNNGYHSWGVGKIFHGSDHKEFGEYGGKFGGFGPRPEKPFVAGHTHPLWDWGAFPNSDEEMPDYKIATWATDKLKTATKKPFFLATGFYRPHVPLYVPKKWFDLYPVDDVKLPPHRKDDFDDVSQYAQDLSWSVVAPRHKWIVDNNQWKHAVQSYLASISFVDAQFGRVITALEKSPAADNTIVVVWSDHGFHMGTKERWGKRSLWEDATKVVLMISVPGQTTAQPCDQPVGLIDLYPTLIDLCGLPQLTDIQGHSLAPLLRNPGADWQWPAITTFGQNNHSVRSRHWRYITYADGSEELYDHRNDPHEFRNLAGDPSQQDRIKTLRRHLPQVNQPMAPGSANLDARPGSVPDIDSKRKRTR